MVMGYSRRNPACLRRTVCPSVMSIAKRGCVLCLGVRVAQGEHLTPDTGAGPCHLPLSEAGT